MFFCFLFSFLNSVTLTQGKHYYIDHSGKNRNVDGSYFSVFYFRFLKSVTFNTGKHYYIDDGGKNRDVDGRW